jgi:hypothetical protein
MKIIDGKKESQSCGAPPTTQYQYTILFLFAIDIVVHGCAHFIFFERAILMGPLAIFWGTWSTPERKRLFATPTAKLKINVQPGIRVYIKGS